jgi:hypothetical protein
MFEHFRADDATLAARHNLADRVIATLAYAGLPARSNGVDPVRSAVEVEVDISKDAVAVVSIRWVPSSELVEGVIDSYRAGRTDGPANESFSAISLFMRDALLHILQHSGFHVRPFDDSAMGPPSISVLGPISEAEGNPAAGEALH